ncbi:ester cyclase [Actinomadura scrupuli]|uniref:ester cyclase n=1 Tax=Actinomadura scrupuli TaxID=559629 RepID=UPI003D981B6C
MSVSSSSWDVKHRLHDAINAHDVHRAIQYYSPDAVLVSPTGVAEGPEEIGWFYQHFFDGFEDYHQTAWAEMECDDPAITEWALTGTHTGPFLLPNGRVLEGTGRHVTVRAACAAYVENGKIVTHRGYFDQLELYSQLGLVLAEPEPPSPPADDVVDPGQRSGWRRMLLRR